MTNLHAKDPAAYKVQDLCRLAGNTKQAYYKHDEDAVMRKAASEELVLQFVHGVRADDPGIGGKKLWLMYKSEFGRSHPVGRDRFESIIDLYGLKLRNKLRRPRTTDSTHGLPTYPNLVKEFIPTAPNQLWVADITYIPIWLGKDTYCFCYLSMVLDAYSEEILGWSVGPTLSTAYPLKALKMALGRIKGREREVNLIHHSDRGVQYASSQYIKLLSSHGIRISMTETGDPKDNAQAERINNTMKNELLRGMRFTSMREVIGAVKPAVSFYNQKRPHMSLDMMTPQQASACTGELRKLWRSYREEYILGSRQPSPQGADVPQCPENAAGALAYP